MKTMHRWIAVLALPFALQAHAHTQLSSSLPADGVSVSAPVTELVLEFGGEVRLTAVSLADAAGAKKAVAELPTAVAAKFAVAVREELAPGDYVIAWRAVGGDTHIVSGEVHFKVAAAHSH
jgi:methionine-rich copper-binding protein CopC